MLKFRLAEFLDKLILIGAMIVFIAIGVSNYFSSRNLDTLTRTQRPILSDRKVNVPAYDAELSPSQKESWASPEHQPRGTEWVFDVFTPPVIYYNPVNQEFSVTPPDMVVRNEDTDTLSFGLELLEVRPRPYRLQLVGYAGQEGSFVAYLKYLPNGNLLLARPGKLLVEAGAKIESFEVKQMQVEQDGGTTVFEKVGVARIRDYDTGEEIYLTNRETKIYSDLEARFRSKGDGAIHVVREGSQVELENGFYIIGDLSANPPEAMVTRISLDGTQRRSRLLTPPSNSRSLQNLEDTRNTTSPFAIRPRIVDLSGPNG